MPTICDIVYNYSCIVVSGHVDNRFWVLRPLGLDVKVPLVFLAAPQELDLLASE